MLCYVIVLLYILYTGQAEHDGNARGHIIDDFIYQTCWNQPLFMEFHIRKLLQDRFDYLARRKIAAEFKDTGKEVWSLCPDSATVLKPLSPKTENCLGSSYRIHEISLRVETVLGRPLPNCV
jgi:hypothetical protein